MKLTADVKARIDQLYYDQLLFTWRNAPLGDPMMQGESGQYWSKRMRDLRDAPGGDDRHVDASKKVGWEQ